MKLSVIIEQIQDNCVEEIINEQSFDRFSRTTSNFDGKVCVYISERKFISTIPLNASMIITSRELLKDIPDGNYGFCISKHPKATYFKCFSCSSNYDNPFSTVVGKDCSISSKAYIEDNNIIIGDNVVIEDFVSIYEGTEIGDNCIIRSGTRLGIQDYNFYEDEGELQHLKHFGKLKLGKNVEIGYNSIVGKALYPGESTVIGDGTKTGGLCSIGHDSIIGKNVQIFAGTILAGFTVVGDNAKLRIGSIIKNGITINNHSQVDMGAVVIHTVEEKSSVFGVPAKKVLSPR